MKDYCDYKELPIYKKAEEISHLVESMTSFVVDYPFEINYPVEQDLVDDSIRSMKEKSLEVRMMIRDNCWEERQYHEAMENAAVIKYYVNEIVCDVNRLENTGLKESEFVDVFHDTLEEFRVLFKEWIKTFPKWKYYNKDWGWGLFEDEDVVEIHFLYGERYDDENPLHRIYYMDDPDAVEDYDEDEDEDFDEDFDEEGFEDDED